MTMAVRMILLVCLGNIYPGARSQLGGSGKWVITVSGCSPLPLLFLCAVLQIHIFCCQAGHFFSVGVVFPVLQVLLQHCVYWVVVGGVITGNVFPPLPPIDSYLSLEFLHPKVCNFERCLFTKRIQGILNLSLTASIKPCAHHMNKRMQSVSNANLLDRTNVSQAVLFCPKL